MINFHRNSNKSLEKKPESVLEKVTLASDLAENVFLKIKNKKIKRKILNFQPKVAPAKWMPSVFFFFVFDKVTDNKHIKVAAQSNAVSVWR